MWVLREGGIIVPAATFRNESTFLIPWPAKQNCAKRQANLKLSHLDIVSEPTSATVDTIEDSSFRWVLDFSSTGCCGCGVHQWPYQKPVRLEAFTESESPKRKWGTHSMGRDSMLVSMLLFGRCDWWLIMPSWFYFRVHPGRWAAVSREMAKMWFQFIAGSRVKHIGKQPRWVPMLL